MAFYQEIQYCIVGNNDFLGDGICHNFGNFNTVGCKFDNGDCKEFNQKFPPNCKAKYPIFLGNGICDGGAYNTFECGFDDGDCLEFNAQFPNCKVDNPILLGNGRCDEGDYQTPECGWDGGDCEEDLSKKYPNCTASDLGKVGDGPCHGGFYNSLECGWDDGDCDLFNMLFPNCTVYYPYWVGNGQCNGGDYNTLECGYDGGDCDVFNEKYPNCTVDRPYQVGDGKCHGGDYQTPECGFDEGDCDEFLAKYPNCTVPFLENIGNGDCDVGDYNTQECGWDGGDCIGFNEKYPNCTVEYPARVGDGWCDTGEYFTRECGWDGGDCIGFNEKYPNCTVESPWRVGNGYCEGGIYNTTECGWDGGDCEDFSVEYPNCNVEYNWFIGDGFCDGGAYTTLECGWEEGDCDDFNAKYPNCTVEYPTYFIGNGQCDGGKFYTEECGWEEGDCDAFFTMYPACTTVKAPNKIGDGFCQYGEYNTPGCGFDGGDCLDFNLEYPDCFGVNKLELGDGICQHNTEGCNLDDGDCTLFNTLYPDCTADTPYLVGDGYCNEEYNTPECKSDGGDCVNTNTTFLFVNGERVSVEEYQKDTQTYVIIQTLSSVVSLVASIGIIWIIHRSFKKLSVPFHRLLFGLCIADVCSSFAQSFSTLPAPDAFDVIWNAQGNKGLCQAQGFFIFLASMAAPLYNCSLCIYYLIVVTYRRGRDADLYIVGKIEFFLHAVPIVVSFVGAITILSMNAFHPNMTYCFIGADPTCEGLECDRSNRNANWLFIFFSAVPYIILPCVIIATMAIMYRAVRLQEKKLQKFGAATLVLRTAVAARAEVNSGKGESSSRNKSRLSSRLKSSMLSLVGRTATTSGTIKNRTSRSNNATKQSRAIMNRALSYSLAFFFTYLFPIIISIRTLIGKESGPVLSILARLFFPLQGFFNFVVFIHPKVVHVKKSSREGITWYRALVKSIQSRGQPRRQVRIKSQSAHRGHKASPVAVFGRICDWIRKKMATRKDETKKQPYRGGGNVTEEKKHEENIAPLNSYVTSQTVSSSNYASNISLHQQLPRSPQQSSKNKSFRTATTSTPASNANSSATMSLHSTTFKNPNSSIIGLYNRSGGVPIDEERISLAKSSIDEKKEGISSSSNQQDEEEMEASD